MTVVQQEDPSNTVSASSHPEEIKSVFDLRVGKDITLHGSFRITPACVISTGIAIAAVALAFGYLTSTMRGYRR